MDINAQKTIQRTRIVLISSAMVLSMNCFAEDEKITSLIQLNDSELSEVQGQSLMSLSYIAPTDTTNLETKRVDGDKNIGFYKLGLEAELQLNANIKKLQLGCGGVNGAGACDIDIDNLSLSGLANTNTGRVSSSAKMTNPFIEFAIKNPNSASTRSIAGIRLSAEKVIGLLTAGTENSTTPNGIKNISGFMRIQSDQSGYIYGLANTSAQKMDVAKYPITGKINSGVGAVLSIQTERGELSIPAMQGIPFIRNGVTVNGNRVSAIPLKATLNIPSIQLGWLDSGYPASGRTQYDYAVETPIDWNPNKVPTLVQTLGGPLSAKITGCQGFTCLFTNIMGTVRVGAVLNNAYLKGNITNMSADVTINQGLGYIHYLPINSAFSLSLQSQSIKWPGSYIGANPERINLDGSINNNVPATISDVARRGWWMSFSDPINLGSVNPTDDINIEPLFPQISTQVSNYLNNNPASIGIGSLINAVLGVGNIQVSSTDINLKQYPLNLNLSNLKLNGQNFAPNCYGSLKFC